MYANIKKEVEEGKVLLEWDKTKGQPPVPLIKDKYAAERRKAKTMNFSLAYGKSAHGFAKDWNCSVKEAKEVLEAWYSERQEVRLWQENVKKIALERYLHKFIKIMRNLSADGPKL
jgi:DNA polymerase-1